MRSKGDTTTHTKKSDGSTVYVIAVVATIVLLQLVSSQSFTTIYDTITSPPISCSSAGDTHDTTGILSATSAWLSDLDSHGVTSCEMVRDYVRTGQWVDPNEGRVYLRQVITQPPFFVSVHKREYDPIRYDSIFLKGDYYEHEVRQRFEYILGETQQAKGDDNGGDHSSQNKKNFSLPIVLDVGGNIGYYSLLSAIWNHAVITFEINPANIVRLCDSLQFNSDPRPMQVRIHRQGVSSVTGNTLEIQVPVNPGQAGLVGSKTATPQQNLHQNATERTFSVSTITLDDFAKQRNWFEKRRQDELHISILKIDTEGHEPQILQGAQKFIQHKLAKNILVEYRPHCREAMNSLLDAGYAIVDDSKQEKRLMTGTQAKTFLDQESIRIKRKTSWNYGDLWFRLQDLPFK